MQHKGLNQARVIHAQQGTRPRSIHQIALHLAMHRNIGKIERRLGVRNRAICALPGRRAKHRDGRAQRVLGSVFGQNVSTLKHYARQRSGCLQVRVIGSHKPFRFQLFQLRADLGLAGLRMPVSQNPVLLDHSGQLLGEAPLGQRGRLRERLNALCRNADLAQGLSQERLWRSLRGQLENR